MNYLSFKLDILIRGILSMDYNISYNDMMNSFKIDDLFKRVLKNKNKNRKDVLEFINFKYEKVNAIIDSLYKKSYTTKKYRKFELFENKKRIIYAPHIDDVFVQHILVDYIKPFIYKKIIPSNVGCRDGWGTQKISKYIKNKILKNKLHNDYYIHFDISKFFYSINRDILIKKLESFINDKDIINLCKKFINIDEVESGLPIGNYFSQLMSLIYMDDLDKFIKHKLKVKYYIRYVDDFLCFGIKTKEEMNKIKDEVIKFLKEKLDLELSMCRINKVKFGIDFCGYIVKNNKIFIRRKNFKKLFKCLKNNKYTSIPSYIGLSLKTNSKDAIYKMLTKHSKKYKFMLPKRTIKNIKRNNN